jgi:hypothetical protein
MGRFCPIQDELHFVSSLAWEVFGQSKVRYILSYFWLRRGLLNTLDIHFVPLLAWEGFGQHKLRYILFPRCHGIGFLNTC